MTVVFLSRAGDVTKVERMCSAEPSDAGDNAKCKEDSTDTTIMNCYCNAADLCNYDSKKADENTAYGAAPPPEGPGDNNNPPKETTGNGGGAGSSNTSVTTTTESSDAASEASERSVSVVFTVMSLVVTAAQFLRSL